MTPLQLFTLSVLVFFAGIVDSLAGGGGLITLPAFLASGLNPALILGTNKLSSCIGTIASTVNYQRRTRISLKSLIPAVLAALIGSYVGARLSVLLDPKWFKPLLLCVIPVVALFLYSNHDFGARDHSASLGAAELSKRSVMIAVPLGLYDGFFGPGTGTFFALAYSHFCRYDLIGSTVRAKFLNLTTNVAALAAFLLAGRVHLKLGLAMAAVSMAGHYVGSHLGLKNGAKIIRPAVLLVCAGLFIKLLLF